MKLKCGEHFENNIKENLEKKAGCANIPLTE